MFTLLFQFGYRAFECWIVEFGLRIGERLRGLVEVRLIFTQSHDVGDGLISAPGPGTSFSFFMFLLPSFRLPACVPGAGRYGSPARE